MDDGVSGKYIAFIFMVKYAKLATSKVITWVYNPEIRNVNFVCSGNLNSNNHVRLSGGNTAFPEAFNIIIINCNWVVSRWQWLFYMYTKHEIGYY